MLKGESPTKLQDFDRKSMSVLRQGDNYLSLFCGVPKFKEDASLLSLLNPAILDNYSTSIGPIVSKLAACNRRWHGGGKW